MQVEGEDSRELQATVPAGDVELLEAGQPCEHVGEALVTTQSINKHVRHQAFFTGATSKAFSFRQPSLKCINMSAV